MLSKMRNAMSTIVSQYLLSPSKIYDKRPTLESLEASQPMWIQAEISELGSRLVASHQTPEVPLNRQRYLLQGMQLPLFDVSKVKQPFDKAVDLVVLFIAGSNAHLLTCRQRAIECAYAAKVAIQSKNRHAKVLLARFNPFGVVNKIDQNHALQPYVASPLSQNDITEDYTECAKLILRRYSHSDLVVMGHSLGGVFSRKVFANLKRSLPDASRVKFVYSAMSLPGIADAFMYYQPATMLRNLIPSKHRAMISAVINFINKYGFSCIQRGLKAAVEASGWKTVPDVILPGEIAQSNILKEKLDHFIPDQVASVQVQSLLNWLLKPTEIGNCHDFPPSKLFDQASNFRSSELDNLIRTLRNVFVGEHVAEPV